MDSMDMKKLQERKRSTSAGIQIGKVIYRCSYIGSTWVHVGGRIARRIGIQCV